MIRSIWVVGLCVALAAAQDAGADPRLAEAQAALDEAVKLKDAGQFAEAMPKAERALSLREAALGAKHLEVAAALDLAGELASRHGDQARAESLLQRALSIRESNLGKKHPEVALTLRNLGNVSLRQGRYEQAQSLYERALEIQEAALGKEHPEVATLLHNMGALSYHQGQYRRSVALYGRALEIREHALGKTHPLTMSTLNNLAVAYATQGQYERAEPLYTRVLEVWEATRGKSSPDVADVLNNLANLYDEQGLHDRAEPLYRRALEIYEAAYGKDGLGVAGAVNNLGEVSVELGQYERADALYQRSLAIREAALGPKHPEVAASLDDLGRLSMEEGRSKRALPLFQRALEIRESALGPEHSDTATSMIDLARANAEQGQYERAESLFQRGLAIREAGLGPEHPFVADTLNHLARLRLLQHRLPEAISALTRSLTISEGRLRREALIFSSARLASFLQFLGTDEQRLYSFARANPGNADVRRLALTASLLFKGRSAEEASATARTVLERLGPEDRDAFERLRGLRTELAQRSLDGPDGPPAEYQRRLKELAEQGDALEADLAKRSAPLRALAALPPPSEIVERVASAIPKDGALVELVAYADRPAVPKPGVPESKLPSQARYLALVLFQDGRTGALDLGPAAPIDAAASRLRDAFAIQDAAAPAASRKLYRLVFKPLLPLLGGAHRLFLSADGQLALVPFAALQDGDRYLADAYDFTYVTCGRDLLPPPGGIAGSSSIAVFADPDYGAAASSPRTAVAERSVSVDRFFSEHRGLSGQRWAALPGSRAEAEAIRQLLPQAQVLVGADASKDRLLALSSPGILHVATHGFFLEDAPSAPGGRGLAVVGPGPVEGSMRHLDPLLRSGLVLSGAGSSPDPGNSMVTALELAGLDLWGTQLVVLSACDTGRGEIKRGQGVYGLRRALVVAGAETVVVSLWKVDDDTTRALMEGYYRNLLAGQGRAQALKSAMLSLRAQHSHPHFWAPFIAIGRDAPLRRPE